MSAHTPRRVINEDELNSYEQEDNYKRKKLLLNCITGVMMVVIIAIPIILGIAMMIDSGIRAKVIDLVATNVPGLMYAGLVAAGIRLGTRKK